MRVLVVNADDFGLARGVNVAVEAAFRDGVLRSASLMATGEAFDDAVSLAKSLPALGVGVHVALVRERPVAPPAALGGLCDREGRLPGSYRAFFARLAARRFRVEDAVREAEAQIARVVDAGLRPTHLDSHDHLHVTPGLLPRMLELARRFGIRAVRLPAEGRAPVSTAGLLRSLQLRGLVALARRAAPAVRASGLRSADRFWGLRCSGALDEDALLRIVAALGEGVHELMSHPARSDEAMRRRHRWGYRWDDELRALTSPRVLEAVRARGIRLASFADAWS